MLRQHTVLALCLSIAPAVTVKLSDFLAQHKKDPLDDLNGNGFLEHGDLAHSMQDSDASDYSVGQFLKRDDARDAADNVDDDDGTGSNGLKKEIARRNKIAEQEREMFDTEDTPDPDALLQKSSRRTPLDEVNGGFLEHGDLAHSMQDSDASDYSVGQFLKRDDARDSADNVDDDDGTGGNGLKKEIARRNKIAEQEREMFDTEDTPDPDALIQMQSSKKDPLDDLNGGFLEHGDLAHSMQDSDASDYSVGQFLKRDDARDSADNVDDDDGTGGNGLKKEIARRNKIAEQEREMFDTEDTPDPDAFIQMQSSKKDPLDDLNGGFLEHGDLAHSMQDSDASDYSVGQFLKRDDARDSADNVDDDDGTGGNGLKKEIARRNKIAEQEREMFDTEDTPDPDAFIQTRSSKKDPLDDLNGGFLEHGDLAHSMQDSDASDYSVGQFLKRDDARDSADNVDDDDGTGGNGLKKEIARRNKIAEQEREMFDTEDTPDPDA